MNMISFNLLATAIISYYASSDPIYSELPECAQSCVKEDTIGIMIKVV